MVRTLRPQDVSDTRARAVLDFLNGATTPQEVADAADIPGVHDIGVRLAERILAARDRLGGFTSLAQVDDVPLIGPLRFTYLVVSLSGPFHRRPERGDPPPAGLARELAELRARVDAMSAATGADRTITIRARQAHPFLGEAIDLGAHVAGPDGQPLIGEPVTLVATWGRLQARDGARLMEGASVTTRTDGNGRARAILLPPVAERLNPPQQSSLATALAVLDRDAPTPAHARKSLRELGNRYHSPAGATLRQAMDVYFRDFGRGITDAVVNRDYLSEWEHIDCTVLAFARDRREQVDSSTVQASAALTIRMRNWLGPWLQIMRDATRENSRLDIDLKLAAQLKEGDLVLGTVYKRLRDFMVDQPGLAGGFVARGVAETALDDFTRQGMIELAPETQLAIAPALSLAAQTVRSSGVTVLAATRQTRVDLTREVDTVIDRKIGGIVVPDLKGVFDELGSLRTRLDSKLDRTQFDSFRSRVDADLADRVTIQTFDGFRSQVNGTLDRKVDSTTFQQFETRITSQLSTKAEITAVQALNTELATVRTTTLQVSNTVSTLDSSVRQLNTDVRDIRRIL